jgi:hypothetical protein
MLDNNNALNLIANDKKTLTRYLLDLCGYSLDQADYNSKGYAFHLHIAFRRQTILQAEKWKAMCEAVTAESFYWCDEETELKKQIQEFAQTIVNEVQQAECDPWGIKLVKTGYLSQLDKARKNSEQAIMLLAAPVNEFHNLTASVVDSNDPETVRYLNALRAHIAYLDSLLSLPFVLENFCMHLAENRGINYEPRKNAEMLASLLDTINLTLNADAPIEVIKTALKIAMPALPMDAALLETINHELVPFIRELIEKSQKLEQAKEAIFPKENSAEAMARKTLLSTVGVEFDSLHEVVASTLLEPVQQCAALAAGVQGLTYAANQAIQRDNVIDRAVNIKQMFEHFDRLASMPDNIPQALLPDWLRETNAYYQLLRTKVSEIQGMAEVAYNGLGIFYNQVVSFIPESIRRYFSTGDSFERVWKTIDSENNSFDVKMEMAHLAFYELVLLGGVQEPIKARFYDAYMRDVLQSSLAANPVNYEMYKESEQGYAACLDKKTSLADCMTRFASHDSSSSSQDTPLIPNKTRKFDVLVMVHHLQNIEAQFNNNLTNSLPVQSLIVELSTALKKEKSNRTINAFRKEFLEPAAQCMLNAYVQNQFIPLLEQVISNPNTSLRINRAHTNRLPDIYSKLRSKVNLSLNDYDELRRCFEGCVQFHPDEFTTLRRLAKQLNKTKKAVDQEIATCQTPHQVMLAEIKASFPHIETAFKAILAGLDKQIDTCEALRALSPPDSNLFTLCQNKINYIEALKTSINGLMQDIRFKPDILAINISDLLNGESLKVAKENLQNTSKLTMVNQMIRFAWHVLPADAEKPDDNFLNNLLVYYLKDTDFGNIHGALQTFNQGLENNPIPELMPLLNDPLAIANIMPKQEEIMDSVVKHLLGLGLEGQSLFAWGTNFVTTTVQKLISGINKDTLVSLFPYPFIGVIAWQMIQSEEMQVMLAPLLVGLVEEYGGVAVDKAYELAEAAKNRIYPLLGIAIQKSVERSAYNYVVAGDKRTVNAADRDAFAMYYLQYQAIRQQNSDVTPKQCVKFLFNVLLEGEDKPARKDMVDRFTTEFLALDEKMGCKLSAKEADNQLLFLITNLNFSDPENNAIIRLTLINRLLMMSLDASKELSTDKAFELEQKSIEAISQLLGKYDDARDLPDNENIQIDGHSFVAPNSTSSMMNALKPAKELAASICLKRLQSAVTETGTLIKKAIAQRNEMIDAHQRQPFLGRSAIEVDYNNAKNNKPRKIVAALSFLFEAVSLVSFWAAVVLPAFMGAGALQSLFVLLGVTAAVGTTATVVGAVLFGVMALARLTFKTGMEIWVRRRELDKIVMDPQRSVLQKIGATLLFGLKCVGLALIKTVFTDFIVNKITHFLAIGPIKRIRDMFRVYPTEEIVKNEQSALEKVANRLQALITLIDQQIASPERSRGEAIERKCSKLKIAMNQASDCLAQVSSNDVRNTESYQTLLASYRANFDAIQKGYQNLKVINQLEQAMDDKCEEVLPQPELQQPGNLATVPDAAPAQKTVVVDLKAYYDKTHPQELIPLYDRLPALIRPSFLISEFFHVLNFAGRIFRREPEVLSIAQKEESAPRQFNVSKELEDLVRLSQIPDSRLTTSDLKSFVMLSSSDFTGNEKAAVSSGSDKSALEALLRQIDTCQIRTTTPAETILPLAVEENSSKGLPLEASALKSWMFLSMSTCSLQGENTRLPPLPASELDNLLSSISMAEETARQITAAPKEEPQAGVYWFNFWSKPRVQGDGESRLAKGIVQEANGTR